jgi:MFS family permease
VTTDAAPSPLVAVLRAPGMRRLLASQTVSAIGDWMATVALMALVLEVTGSSTAVAGVLVLRLAPSAVAGPFVTRAVTRWDRRRTMMLMDLARAGIAIAVPLVRALWWVYLWAFALEVAGLIFLPARDAAIPDLAPHEDLPVANGLILGSSYGTIPIGAALFGGVRALAGRHGGGAMMAVFTIDAVTFLFSFLMLTGIGNLPGFRSREVESPPRLRDALALPIVRTMIVPAAVVSLGIGSLFSLGIVFVRSVLGASETQFGVLVMMFGVGAAAGIAILQTTRAKGIPVVLFAVALQGAVIGGMSLSRWLSLTFLGAAMFGASTAVALASAMGVLQDNLDDRARVVAFAAFHIVIRSGLALAAIASGVAADLVEDVDWPGFGTLPPARVVLLCSGALIVASSFITARLRVEPGS